MKLTLTVHVVVELGPEDSREILGTNAPEVAARLAEDRVKTWFPGLPCHVTATASMPEEGGDE